VLDEAKGVKKTWAEIKTEAKNRVRWRILVEAHVLRRNDGICHDWVAILKHRMEW
jgi:hypothetical protein